MPDELRGFETKSRHNGVFGDYTIFGRRYEFEDGRTSWDIGSRETADTPVEKWYLVTAGEFASFSMQDLCNGTGKSLIHILGVVTDIDPAEKEAILKAITQWEAADRAAQIKH
jgi:hypothetical protein